MKYKIGLRRTKGGYSAWVPGLPGCWSEGATRKESIENIQVAIQEYLTAADELLRGERL